MPEPITAGILEALADLLADRVADRIAARLPRAESAAPPPPAKLLLTTEQAAEQLQVSEATIKRLIRDEELTPIKVAGCTRVATAELAQFIERKSRGATRGSEKECTCSLPRQAN